MSFEIHFWWVSVFLSSTKSSLNQRYRTHLFPLIYRLSGRRTAPQNNTGNSRGFFFLYVASVLTFMFTSPFFWSPPSSKSAKTLFFCCCYVAAIVSLFDVSPCLLIHIFWKLLLSTSPYGQLLLLLGLNCVLLLLCYCVCSLALFCKGKVQKPKPFVVHVELFCLFVCFLFKWVALGKGFTPFWLLNL